MSKNVTIAQWAKVQENFDLEQRAKNRPACTGCGHQHAAVMGGICIGCPCQTIIGYEGEKP